MKNTLILLFAFIASYAYAQDISKAVNLKKYAERMLLIPNKSSS